MRELPFAPHAVNQWNAISDQLQRPLWIWKSPSILAAESASGVQSRLDCAVLIAWEISVLGVLEVGHSLVIKVCRQKRCKKSGSVRMIWNEKEKHVLDICCCLSKSLLKDLLYIVSHNTTWFSSYFGQFFRFYVQNKIEFSPVWGVMSHTLQLQHFGLTDRQAGSQRDTQMFSIRSIPVLLI